MTFQNNKVQDFLALYRNVEPKIRQSSGCKKLILLKDIREHNIFFTYSYWEDDQSLQTYRNSDLFDTTWKETKKFFSEKALAWSLEIVSSVE